MKTALTAMTAILVFAMATATTTEAKPRKHHRTHHHAQQHYQHQHHYRKHSKRQRHRHHKRHTAKTPQTNPMLFPWFASAEQKTPARSRKRATHNRHSNYSLSSNAMSANGISSFGGSGRGSAMIATARSYTGTNPTRRSRQWCGEFMGLVVRKTGGRVPEGYAKASSWAKLPRTTMRVGAVAVMPHHVGIVTGQCENGDVRIVSGNHGRRVGEGCYPRKRIIAFVEP